MSIKNIQLGNRMKVLKSNKVHLNVKWLALFVTNEFHKKNQITCFKK